MAAPPSWRQTVTLIGRVVQRVERRKIALARNAEDVIDPVDEKLIDENLAAGAGGRCHGRLAMCDGKWKGKAEGPWPSACDSLGPRRSGVDVELHALGQRQGRAVVDRVGGAAHVGLPGVRAGLAAAAGLLLAAEGAADLGARGADIDVGDAAIRARAPR